MYLRNGTQLLSLRPPEKLVGERLAGSGATNTHTIRVEEGLCQFCTGTNLFPLLSHLGRASVHHQAALVPLPGAEQQGVGSCGVQDMPFRVYMGYDSHEDITFEVSHPPRPRAQRSPLRLLSWDSGVQWRRGGDRETESTHGIRRHEHNQCVRRRRPLTA